MGAVISINFRVIGLMLVGMSAVLLFTTLSFTHTILRLNEEIHKACPLPPEICPAKRNVLPPETIVSVFVVVCLGGLGSFFLIKTKRIEKITIKERVELKDIVKLLGKDEKRVYDEIIASDGFIFQADLVKKTGYSKVKVSRILDKLEAKGIVERRRRGMANVVVVKS